MVFLYWQKFSAEIWFRENTTGVKVLNLKCVYVEFIA